MALPAIKDLQLYSGDTSLFIFQWTDVDGNPIAIKNSQVRLAAKRNMTDQIPLFIVNAQIFNEQKGKFAIPFPSEATHNIGNGLPVNLVYDVQITLPNNYVRTLFRGQLSIIPEVY